MTQYAYPTIVANTHDGSNLADFLNQRQAAENTLHSGVSRPAYALPGMIWADTSVAGRISLKVFDGSIDILIGHFTIGNPNSPFLPSSGGSLSGGLSIPSGAAINFPSANGQYAQIILTNSNGLVTIAPSIAPQNSIASWFGHPTNPAYVYARTNNVNQVNLRCETIPGQAVPPFDILNGGNVMFSVSETGNIITRSLNGAKAGITMVAGTAQGAPYIHFVDTAAAATVAQIGFDGIYTTEKSSGLRINGMYQSGSNNMQNFLMTDTMWPPQILALQTIHNPGVEVYWSFLIGGARFDFLNNGQIRTPTGQVIISDRKLKTDINPLTQPLDKINYLNGVEFERTDIKDYHGNPIRQIGLVAQDVQKALPTAVSSFKAEDENETLSYDPNAVLALAVEAIKELSAKVLTLERKVTSLEEQVELLRNPT